MCDIACNSLFHLKLLKDTNSTCESSKHFIVSKHKYNLTLNTLFAGQQFLIKKKFLKLLGDDFKVFNSEQKHILFAHLKTFKWKEDITQYIDVSKTEPVLNIKARQIIDFSAAYDFFDAKTGQKIGAVKRKGWKSMLRDEWIIMDSNDHEIEKNSGR